MVKQINSKPYKRHWRHFPYRWYWVKKLGSRKNWPCNVLARGKLNSVLVRFADGYEVITSRNAVRKAKNRIRG